MNNRYKTIVSFYVLLIILCCDSNTNIVNLKQTNIKAAWLSGRIQDRYLTGVGSIPGHAKYFILILHGGH